jgi:hypothetical protein
LGTAQNSRVVFFGAHRLASSGKPMKNALSKKHHQQPDWIFGMSILVGSVFLTNEHRRSTEK